MPSEEVLSQLRFIDDAVRKSPSGLRIYLCSAQTLDALIPLPLVGDIRPTVVTHTSGKTPYNLEIARKDVTGFEIYDTRNMAPELALEWATAAKRRVYPFRYEHKLHMALLSDHYRNASFDNSLKLVACIAEMDNEHQLSDLREENNF